MFEESKRSTTNPKGDCRRTPLRIALLGKGGAGKSMIAGTLARSLAADGRQVLALDVDTMPGLAISLGLPAAAAARATIPAEFGERQEGRGWVLKDGVDVAELVNRFSVEAPDGIRYLQLGKLPDSVKPGSTTAFWAVLNDFRADGWSLVGDLAAGTRQPFYGWSRFAQIVLLVVEPSAKAVLTASKLARLRERQADGRQLIGIIANKIRSSGELAQLRHLLEQTDAASLPLLAVVPYDLDVAAAERQGVAAIDVAPRVPAVQAIAELAGRLQRQASTGHEG